MDSEYQSMTWKLVQPARRDSCRLRRCYQHTVCHTQHCLMYNALIPLTGQVIRPPTFNAPSHPAHPAFQSRHQAPQGGPSSPSPYCSSHPSPASLLRRYPMLAT